MVELTERGEPIAFSFEDVMRYHGGHSPGGAAITFKALELALPRLAPCERRGACSSASYSASPTRARP